MEKRYNETQQHIKDNQLNISLPDLDQTIDETYQKTNQIVEAIYCSLCSANTSNVIMTFQNSTKLNTNNYLRYIFAADLVTALSPLDLTFDVD